MCKFFDTFLLYFQSFYDRTFKEGNHVFPVDSVDGFIALALHFHELIAGLEALFMKGAASAVVMEQTDEASVLGHHDEDIVFLRLPVELLPDYRADAVVLATHVVEVPQEIELVDT